MTNSDGGRSAFYPAKGAKRVTVPGVGSNERPSVSVVAVSAAGRRGPAGRALTAPKKRRGRK